MSAGLVQRLLAALRRGVTQDVGLKSFSLVVAVVVFAYVRGSEDAQRYVFVDVVALQPTSDSEFVLVSEVPDRVRLALRGSRAVLNSIRREEVSTVQIQVDPSRRNYYFEPSDFVLPAGVTVDQIVPASFAMTWTPRIEQSVPVRVRFVGKLDRGLELDGKPVTQPAMLTVRGPAAEVEAFPTVGTEDVDLSRFGIGRHEFRVRLEEPSPHVSYNWDGPVSVAFEVRQELVERRFAAVPIAVVGGHPLVDLRPRRAQVVVRGPPALVQGLDADTLVPWIDTSDSSGETQSVEVHVRGLPEGVQLVRVEPREVFVFQRTRR
ncbi:MAG: hypothetical protein R3A78_09400 [Polyangiales bacterium]|nr:hypothetical protein [Myxococcales bacterium]